MTQAIEPMDKWQKRLVEIYLLVDLNQLDLDGRDDIVQKLHECGLIKLTYKAKVVVPAYAESNNANEADVQHLIRECGCGRGEAESALRKHGNVGDAMQYIVLGYVD